MKGLEQLIVSLDWSMTGAFRGKKRIRVRGCVAKRVIEGRGVDGR